MSVRRSVRPSVCPFPSLLIKTQNQIESEMNRTSTHAVRPMDFINVVVIVVVVVVAVAVNSVFFVSLSRDR